VLAKFNSDLLNSGHALHAGKASIGFVPWLKQEVSRHSLGHWIERDHMGLRLVHLNASVVIDKAELARAIRKQADARPCGADHLRQRLLCNGRDKGLRISRLAMHRHQQESSCQALFAEVEELADKIGLGL
jgi:hypothetical protein